MKTPMKLLSAAITAACGAYSYTAMAATPANGDILTIDAGVEVLDAYGSCCSNVSDGSFFGMDTDGNSKIAGTEKTPLAQGTTGITIGTTTSPGASHTGDPEAGDTNEVDAPWGFFGNTGSDYLTVGVTGDTTTTTGTGLDFSGWTVTWNAIEKIPMNSRAWQPGNCTNLGCDGMTFVDGIANFQWSGVYGDPYTIDYTATVPDGDPSGFGNVKYYLRLKGTVIQPPAPVPNVGVLGPGTFATALGATNSRISYNDFINGGFGAPDDSDNFSYGTLFDFSVSGLGGAGSVQVVATLVSPIPAGAVYRKYDPSTQTWSTFTPDTNNNLIASTAQVTGVCPAPGDTAYDHNNGLVEGDDCFQITLDDDGTYDSNNTADTVDDPGGIATAVIISTLPSPPATSGCSVTSHHGGGIKHHAEWWLVGGFIALLGLFRLKRKPE